MLALTLMGSAGARAENPGTAEQRAACTPDAMRLCSAEVPNVPAIIACMKRKRALVSVECRTAMAEAEGPLPDAAEPQTMPRKSGPSTGVTPQR